MNGSTRRHRTALRSGLFSFKNISCVLSRKRHSSGKSPVAHLIVRMSSPRNKRLLWLAPAKETMASRCSCRSPVGPGALVGNSLTCVSEAIPVMVRPCTLIAGRASLYRPPPQAIWAASAHSALVGCVLMPELRGMRAAVPRSAAHQSRHGFADGSSGCQGAGSRFPRCSSVCDCTLLAVLRSGPEFC